MTDTLTAARVPAAFCAHGGRVAAARAAYGGDDWIDLSTGIAPWPWPIAATPLDLDRLPEPAAIAALEAAAAAAFGVADPRHVVAVPGTDLAMRLLAPVIAAQRPAVVHPGYAGHGAAWPEAEAVAPDRIADLARPDLLVLASPANPDGRITDPATLRALAARMTVVVDEAYADPRTGSCPDASDALIVLRSFGKYFGLPGLRLGFVIAGARIAAELRARLGDWPVSSAAIAIGSAAYRDAAWCAAQDSRIAGAGTLLDRVLHEANLTIVGRAPLFRLVACADAHDVFTALARHAILTRPFADRRDRLRIGLPRDALALARLAASLKEFAR